MKNVLYMPYYSASPAWQAAVTAVSVPACDSNNMHRDTGKRLVLAHEKPMF